MARCPVCWVEVPSQATVCCDACHAARVAALRAKEALEPGRPEHTDGTDHRYLCMGRAGPVYERPHSSGRRVVRKPEIYS